MLTLIVYYTQKILVIFFINSPSTGLPMAWRICHFVDFGRTCIRLVVVDHHVFLIWLVKLVALVAEAVKGLVCRFNIDKRILRILPKAD